MCSFLAIHHTRHLSTAAAAATTKPITISHIKNRLARLHDPDEILKIYASFSAANQSAAASTDVRYAREFIVRRLVQSGRFSDIETFLDWHKTHPQITQEPFLSSLIRSYGVAGMFENALKTYQQMSQFGTPRSALSFNALLHACVNFKLFDRVPVYFDEFPPRFGFSPDKISYGILIKAYCEMGLPDTAMEKLNLMAEKDIEVSPITLTTILDALYKKGQIDEAEFFWNEMVMKTSFSPDVVSFNVRLMHNQNPESVGKLIEEMRNAGIKPNVITYNLLITFYCENKMFDEVKNILKEIVEAKECNPNAATFRRLVFHLCKNGWVLMGYEVFKHSVKVHKNPDFDTLKYLAERLVETGHMNGAKDLIHTMNKKLPPNLLSDWGKLADELGLACVGEEEVDSGEREETIL